jgi:hypothetical protein
VKRARRTPKPAERPEGLDDYQAPAPGLDDVVPFDNVAMNRQIERQETYEHLAKAAGADPGQAVVLCADGSVRLLERAVINRPRPLPEPLADGTKIDVNNYEALWLTYDERNYNERTYVGNNPFTDTGHHPDVPLYTVTNKNTPRNKPSWWKESQ